MTGGQREEGWPPEPEDFEQDLGSDIGAEERAELLALAARLTEQRPVPSPGLRSRARSGLLGGGRGVPRSRVAAVVFGYAASGALLLAIAAVGLVGIGPFAA